MKVHKVSKDLVRTSKVEWRDVIYTRRGQKVWMRKEILSMG